MKKLLILVILCFTFALTPNVYASNETSIYINNKNYQFTSNNFHIAQQGQQKFILELFGNSILDKYFVFVMCTDSETITSWNSTGLTEFNIYSTKYNCNFPNSSYTGGHVVYLYGSTNYNDSANCSVTGDNCLLDTSVIYQQPNQSSWALLSSSLSSTPFTIDYASDSLMNQNQSIINQNNYIIEQNNNIYDNITNQGNSIIGNAAQNTQDIINNQIQSSQDIINNQIENSKNEIENNNQLIKGECSMQPGKNLFNYVDNLNSSIGGLTNTLNKDGSITTTGILTKNHTNIVNPINITNLLKDGEIYMLSQENYKAAYNLRLVVGLFTLETDTMPSSYITTDSYAKSFKVDFAKYKKYLIWIQTDTTANWGTESKTFTNKYMLSKGTNTNFEPYELKEVCEGGLTGSVDNVKDSVDDLNNSITDSNVDNSSANSFFSDFKSDDYGLSAVITAPLQFIKDLNSNTCKPIDLTLPYVDKDFQLPCMSTIYTTHFGSFFSIYQTITTGFIAYWVCVRIFELVKGFKDPENDKLEVMDL